MIEGTKNILLVEDEVPVAKIVKDYLEGAHYSVQMSHTGAGVVEQVRDDPPSLILLDVMLPEVDGTTICREIRAFSSVPIIMLTAKVDEYDRLIGYELGADDYICKPVNPREILARVKAVLRRGQAIHASDSVALQIDDVKFSAVYKGKPLDLTATEFRLLKLLADKKGQLFSRRQIMDAIYDEASEASERSVDTCVKKLRRKISAASDGDNPIRAVYSMGYKYEDV